MLPCPLFLLLLLGKGGCFKRKPQKGGEAHHTDTKTAKSPEPVVVAASKSKQALIEGGRKVRCVAELAKNLASRLRQIPT